MDIKREAEFKVEILEAAEEDETVNSYFEQHSTLEDIQDRKCLDVKSEIEIKRNEFDIKEEDAANDELFDETFHLDQNK
ncbi:hypothetical protein Avbf_14039, partial [Armadillidium vulgare]